MADEHVERVRHVAANMQGPLVPGYTYVRDTTPQQIAQEAADAQARATAGMSGGGGGYKLDPDAAKGIIGEINDLLDWIQSDIRPNARQLAAIKPMGDEMASSNYVQDANAAGTSYANYLDSVVAELKRQRDAIQQAVKVYRGQESATADHVKGIASHHA